jgi:threonine dehydrogenase-like Zn-dependent dehydrogenase
VAVGERVKKFKVGDRVTRPAAIWPGTRSADGLFSAWGGFAEYGIVRDGPAMAAAGDLAAGDDYTCLRQNVVPAGISPVDAALAISVSEIASWMWKLGPVGGRSLAVMGTGFAALAMVILAKLAGAGPIVALGRRDERLSHAARCGADVTINIKRESDIRGAVHRATRGGADYAAEATGVDAMLGHVLESLRPGGTAAIYGAPENYRYTLPLRSAGGEFSLRLINAEEHLAYAHVCDLLARKAIDPTLLRSHVWHGLQSVSGAVDAVARGEVTKGIVALDG